MVDNVIALRCKYCGAPLDRKDAEGDSPYVTCPSCGTTQQRVDAEAYLQQLMGQVRSWINKAVPGGMSAAQSENVDSVARYNIFMNSVKPRVDMEFGEYKFALMSLLAHPMLVMPFTVDTSISAKHDPAQLFEFGERMSGIAPLAVDQESRDLVTGAKDMSDAYALLVNNSKLLAEDKPGRYVLMYNNFTTAAQDFKDVDGYGPAYVRFDGLADASQGCEKMLNGDIAGAVGLLESAKTKLAQAAKDCVSNMKVAIMGQAVNAELKQVEVLTELAEHVNALGGDPLKMLDSVRKIFTYTYPTAGDWGYMLNNKDRMGEIFDNMSKAVTSKNGGAGVAVAGGDGDILVPFWHIDLDYSFQTGSLWKKKAVEVHEDLLVCADFTVDEECLANPRSAVTDVFSVRADNGLFAGITGNEKSISNGSGIARVANSASEAGTGSREIVIPLSTRREAEKLAEDYVRGVAATEGKLRLSNPEVEGLVYVPCRRDGNRVSNPPSLGRLAPARLSRMNLDDLVVL